jgi:hypothetical protein
MKILQDDSVTLTKVITCVKYILSEGSKMARVVFLYHIFMYDIHGIR